MGYDVFVFYNRETRVCIFCQPVPYISINEIHRSKLFPTGWAVAATRFNGCAAVGAIANSSPDHAVDPVRVNFRGRVVFQPASFVSADFVDRAAVRAGDEISLSEPEERKEEQNQAPTDAGDSCQ